MNVSVVVPTVKGREEYLARCLRGYRERTAADVDLQFIVVGDRPTCGEAWQLGAGEAEGDYLHLTADDIVPGEGWLDPLIERVGQGLVPAAGVVTCIPEILDEDQMPLAGNPRPGTHAFYFEDQLDHPDGMIATTESQYPAVPFCSMEQWARIGPMIAIHYGTDKWFGWRAKQAGIDTAVTAGSVFYHYVAHAGRAPKADGWLHVDRLTYDLMFGLPQYQHDGLDPAVRPKDWDTPEGLAATRRWYRTFQPPPYYWEAAS